MYTSQLRKLSATALIVSAAVFGVTALAGCSTTAEADPIQSTAKMDHAAMESSAELELRSAMQDLWQEHMAWTWSTVVAFVDESPALDSTLTRLLQNQADIGAAVAAYYGEDAGDAITVLLEEHIQLAVPVLTAAKAGDTAALDTAVENWYANAEEIGVFLSSANPEAWDEAELVDMMRGHITQTVAYASDLLAGDHQKAIENYEIAQDHMIHMGQALSDGIIAQFPEKF